MTQPVTRHKPRPRAVTARAFAVAAAVMVAGAGGLAAAYVDAQADVAVLGDQVRALGAVPAVAPSLPIESTPGPAGRGVLGTDVVDGRLIVFYSDGARDDAGQVMGAPGVVGPEGRGVTDTDVDAGRLVVSYSDGTTQDLGPVIGPRGVGVADVDGTTGRLLVTLTDGEVLDAGPLPPGRDGQNGTDAPVQRGAVFRLDDGRTFVCDRTGGPDDFPEFDCPTPPGSTPPGPAPEPDPDPPPMGG